MPPPPYFLPLQRGIKRFFLNVEGLLALNRRRTPCVHSTPLHLKTGHFQLKMLLVNPQEVVFRDVSLNHSFHRTISITNNLHSAVDFGLRTNAAARYTITPATCRLAPGESTIVNLRLCVSTFPSYARGVSFDRRVPSCTSTASPRFPFQSRRRFSSH